MSVTGCEKSIVVTLSGSERFITHRRRTYRNVPLPWKQPAFLHGRVAAKLWLASPSDSLDDR